MSDREYFCPVCYGKREGRELICPRCEPVEFEGWAAAARKTLPGDDPHSQCDCEECQLLRSQEGHL